MKPKLLLLSVCFSVFYLFTDLNWQVGHYLSQHEFYANLWHHRSLISSITGLISFLLCAIIGYYVFYELLYRRKNKFLSIVAYLLFGIPFMIFCRYLVQEVLAYGIWGYHNYSEDMRQPLRYFMDNIYFSVYYSGFGLVFFFIQFSGYNLKVQNELVLQNRTAELSFLRSQVNPHFLFNSLNNVYTLVYQGSQKALPAIGKLSELLRYMLYEKEELVPLDKEVQYLLNYIDLQLMRYDFDPFKEIIINTPANNKFNIAPLTLIPFVENAFKHGDLRDSAYPLKIKLTVEGKQLQLDVENKTGDFFKDEQGGIGLENVKKRLRLIYGADHDLQLHEPDGLFKVKLKINLHG